MSEPIRVINYLYPLRPALNVSISNLPIDLTRKEVERLVAFLGLLVIPKQEGKNEHRE